MSFVLADLVQETASNPGTGTVNLAGAVSGRRAFVTAWGNGNSGYYVITDGTKTEWGIGTVTAGTPNTLSRDTILGNTSETGVALNFTGAVKVYGGLPASKTVYMDSTGLFAIPQAFALTGDISPSQITSTQNNYNPTGLATAAVLRLNSDAARSLTGLQGGSDGRLLVVENIGAFNITLTDENSGSSAANRFALVSDLALAPDQAVVLKYDATSSRWRVLGGIGLNSVTNAMLATMAQATVKGRAAGAGTGNATDLTAAQVAAIIAAVGGALQFKIGTFNIDISTTGTQAITGVGSTPRLVILFGAQTAAVPMSLGVDDGTNAYAIASYSGTTPGSWDVDATNSIYLIQSSGNTSKSKITSLDADGFTITKTKAGTPTGTINMFYIALR